jgi:hypothetical protein
MIAWALVIGSGLVPAVLFFAAWRAARERVERAEQHERVLRDLLNIERAATRKWMDLARERWMTIELLRGSDLLWWKRP